jgi:hypothetical protein
VIAFEVERKGKNMKQKLCTILVMVAIIMIVSIPSMAGDRLPRLERGASAGAQDFTCPNTWKDACSVLTSQQQKINGLQTQIDNIQLLKGLKGDPGPKGDQGIKGDMGEKGAKGDLGPKGDQE